jgi:hypothetical protein
VAPRTRMFTARSARCIGRAERYRSLAADIADVR